jgi:hypothetical protein
MTDTPLTDAVLASYFNPGPSRLCDLARELERELNAANATIRQQQKVGDDLREWLKTILCEILEVDDGSQILDAIQELKERVKRLEEKESKP